MVRVENVQWLGSPGKRVLETVEVPDEFATAPDPPEDSRECYLCREPGNRASLISCGSCTRVFHDGCTEIDSIGACSECRKVCAKCWRPVEVNIECPYCGLKFHISCAKMMESNGIAQVCRYCVKEQLRFGVEVCTVEEEYHGNLCHRVKFICLSVLHQTWIKPNKCSSRRHAQGHIPDCDRFLPTEELREFHGVQQVKVLFNEDDKEYWEPLETVERYQTLLQETYLYEEPEARDMQSARFDEYARNAQEWDNPGFQQMESSGETPTMQPEICMKESLSITPPLPKEESSNTEAEAFPPSAYLSQAPISSQLIPDSSKEASQPNPTDAFVSSAYLAQYPMIPQPIPEPSVATFQPNPIETFAQAPMIRQPIPDSLKEASQPNPTDAFVSSAHLAQSPMISQPLSEPSVATFQPNPIAQIVTKIEWPFNRRDSELSSGMAIDISDDEEGFGPAPTSPIDEIPPAAVAQATALLLSFGFCPSHPQYLSACIRKTGVPDDPECRVENIAFELYNRAIEERHFTYSHQWKPAYDNLLAALALRYGLDRFPSKMKTYKPLKEWFTLAYPESTRTSEYEVMVSSFSTQRVRFIVYCLIADAGYI